MGIYSLYKNERLRKRILNIDVAENLFASISTNKTKNSFKQKLTGSDQHFYLTPEFTGSNDDKNIFNMPFLINGDGTPWWEANSYLCHLIEHKHVMQRPTEDVHRTASRLMGYKLFTEDEGIDWLDFTGRRLSSRPTYRYFHYLYEIKALSPAVVNQYTGDVYKLYMHTSENGHSHKIPMDRVDSVKTINMFYSSARGVHSKSVLKRSQTRAVPPTANCPTGYVRDEGETLRPLSDEQISELKDIINSDSWSPIERLIVLTSLLTGARKQTVLTIRVKHINQLIEEKPEPDNTYKLFAGPGTSIDTKNDKKQTLYIPAQLVRELAIYANCEHAKLRREKFKANYCENYPSVLPVDDDDMYLFLSDQGNCYYLAKSDPRYPVVKSRPVGQVVDQLKRKILRSASSDFPRDFYYHWLRASHAYLLWLAFQKHIESGAINESGVLSFIQKRLHHNQRSTTENYLKLFDNIDFQLDIQEAFEDYLLKDILDDEHSTGRQRGKK
jgi:hypothetical protein